MLIGIDASRATGTQLTGTERYSREIIATLVRVARQHAPQHQFRLYFRDDPASFPPLEAGGVVGVEFPPSAVGSGDAVSTEVEFSPLELALSLPKGVGGEVETVVIRQSRLWTHLGLARELVAHPPDALFVPAHVLPISFVRLNVRRAIRSVVTVHDLGYRHFPAAHPVSQRQYLDLSTRFSVNYSGAVIADSEATRRDITNFYGLDPTNIAVAYPGPLPLLDVTEDAVSKTLSKFGLHTDQPYALHVGTLQPRKNLRRLVQAWARIVHQHKAGDAQLVLAGGQGWRGEDLQAEVERLKLKNKVKLVGYVSDAEKSVLMRCARAYAFPSLYEGFGFPMLEAQSAGVPVICSNTSSLPEVAGDAALLFDPSNVDELANALDQVMCDEPLRARLIEAGYRNVKRFSWEDCARVVLRRLEIRD